MNAQKDKYDAIYMMFIVLVYGLLLIGNTFWR